MNLEDLNSIIRLSGIKRINEYEGDPNTGAQPPTKDPNTPTTFIPTHYHETNFGKKDPLMMTEPGVFWSKSGGNITRFVPKDWDPVASTKPGFDNRLSVDGEIGDDGKYYNYKGTVNNWKDALKISNPAWTPARVAGAYPSTAPASPAGASPAGASPAGTPPAVGSIKPEPNPATVSSQPVANPRINVQSIPVQPAGEQQGTKEPTVAQLQQAAGINSAPNNSTAPVAVPPGVNDENGLQKYTPVNFSNDKLKEPPGADKKKVLAPVDKDLQAVQKVLSGIDPKYKELLGPYGADGRIGKYTRNALAQYIKDVPSAKEHDVLKPILTKYGIIASEPSGPSGPTSSSGTSGASGASTPNTFSQDTAERKAAMKNAASASTAPSGPAGSPIPSSALPPGPSGAIVPGALTPGLGNATATAPATSGPAAAPTAPATSGPAAAPTAPATSGPAAAPTAPAAGGSAKEVRQRIQALATKYKVSESRLTPVGQIQKFRQLIDEADWSDEFKQGIAQANAEAERLRASGNSSSNKSPWAYTPLEPAKSNLGNPESVAGKPPSKLGDLSSLVSGTEEPKLGNLAEPVRPPPPKAGTPVPGNPGYEFTGEVDAKGKPKARKIIVPPAAIAAEVTAAQQAGKLGLKQALPRVLGMTTRVWSFATGWQVAAAMMAMTAIGWMYDIAYENGTRVNISREDMVQLGKDKQALEALANNKNLSPEEQKEVQAAMEQMAKLLANSETIDNVWAKVGIPGGYRQGISKNK